MKSDFAYLKYLGVVLCISSLIFIFIHVAASFDLVGLTVKSSLTDTEISWAYEFIGVKHCSEDYFEVI